MPECYKCLDKSCEGSLSDLETCVAKQYCFTQTRIHELKKGQVLGYERGCEAAPDAQFSSCHVYLATKPEVFPDLHLNCCDKNKCNDAAFASLHLDRPYSAMSPFGLAIAFASLILLLIVSFVFYKLIKKRPHSGKNNNAGYELGNVDGKPSYDEDSIDFDVPKKSKMKKLKDAMKAMPDETEEFDLSSRGPFRKMQERTLSKDIRLETMIGQGRYGKVWKARWNNDDVAVKTIFAREHASYTQEKMIYDAMNMTMSKYILNFRAADIRSPDGVTEYWIITDYCPLGSLFDFLSLHTLTLAAARSIIDSILAGFIYLHRDMYISSRKPQIAHRDIKSKNILMSSPTQCVIADFGLAVTYYNGGELKVPLSYQVGTKRYMAPEILDSTFNNNRFSSYLMTDIYSIGLVLWEIIHRVEHLPDIQAQPFSVVYDGMVPPDPSFDNMREVVCLQKRRPPIHPSLNKNEFLNTVAKMIDEACKTKPVSRPTIGNMKKTIEELDHRVD